MHHATVSIACFIILNIYITANCDITTSDGQIRLKIRDIAIGLMRALGVPPGSNITRINELKDKLNKINTYAINHDKYASLLTNVTMESELNQTDFFRAMSEDEQFKFLTEKEPKSLYLKMKEKMNRHDIFEILAARGNNSNILTAARKSNDFDYFAKNDDDLLDIVVDKMIGESPADNHNYTVRKNSNRYWGMYIFVLFAHRLCRPCSGFCVPMSNLKSSG